MPEANEPHWNGWGVDVEQHRFQPGSMAQLPADEVPRLKLKWAFGYEDANQAYAQPTVVGGRIFVGSVGRRVYSINARSGCIYWIIRTDFAVRTAISIGSHGTGWSAYFGDQHGNAYAVDATTGKLLWKTRLD
ncbi:MAG: PQQ-binding-like beta-propeller repeat protein, partial [Terriglobia bacterium]